MALEPGPFSQDPYNNIVKVQWSGGFVLGGGWLEVAQGPSNPDTDPLHMAEYTAVADPLPVHATFWKLYDTKATLKFAGKADMRGAVNSGFHRPGWAGFPEPQPLVWDWLYGPSAELFEVYSVALSGSKIAIGLGNMTDDVSVADMQFQKLVNVYDKSGKLLWRAWNAIPQIYHVLPDGVTFAGYNPNCTTPTTMSFDSDGNLIIGGDSDREEYPSAPTRRKRAVLAKYNTIGKLLWRIEDFDDITPIQSTFRGLSIDKDNNIVVSGPMADNQPGAADDGPSTVSVYSGKTGASIKRLTVPAFSSGQTVSDGLGNVYVFGAVYDPSLRNKVFKFGPLGTLLSTLDIGADGQDPAFALDISPQGKICAAAGSVVKCYAASTVRNPTSNPQIWSVTTAMTNIKRLIALSANVLISDGLTYQVRAGKDGALVSSGTFSVNPGPYLTGAIHDIQRSFRKPSVPLA